MLNSKFGTRQAANVIANTEGLSNQGSGGNNNGQAQANEQYVIAKYSYQSQGPQELSMTKGDKLLLIDSSKHWWKVINSNNETGFVPSNYVKLEKLSLFDSIKRGIRANTKPKKLPLTFSNNSPSSSPLISRSLINETTTISPMREQNFPFKKPYGGENNEFTAPSNVGKQQPQSHSDILVRELGPNFNGSILTQDGMNLINNNVDLNNQNHDNNAPSLKTLNSTVATVKYNYKSQQSDELSLTKGSKISVIEKSDDGWWKGELDGKVGWFPSNYVIERPINESNNEKTSLNKFDSPLKAQQLTQRVTTNSISNKQSNLHSPTLANETMSNDQVQYDRDCNFDEVLFVVVALYSFQSQSEEELSFSKDERLDIVEKPANDPDWWRACNQLGETGLVPKNYVQIVPNLRSIRSWSAKSPVKKPPAGDSFNTGKTSNTPVASALLAQTNYSFDSSISHQDGANQITDNQFTLTQLAHDLEVKLKLNDKVWYHGIMSRKQCDQLLNAYADDGDFLIRNSETNAGDFSVSLKAPERNKHFRVHYVEDSFCIGQRKFDTLDELVEHYKRTPIYTSASGEKMFLKKPYCR